MSGLQADQPVSMILGAQQWNIVMAALHELPYRVAAPVVEALTQQFQAVAQAEAREAMVTAQTVNEKPGTD